MDKSESNDRPRKGILVSDFNLGNLAGYLNNGTAEPRVLAEVLPFGQVVQTLLDDSLPCWSAPLDFVIIWTRPEGTIDGFRNLLDGVAVEKSAILSQVDEFCSLVVGASSRSKALFVPLWVLPAMHSGHGLRDFAPQSGVSRVLLEMNLRLLENLEKAKNVFPLNTSGWIEQVGPKSFSPRLWYGGKIPFSSEVFKAAAGEIKSALRGIEGRARKLIVVDLDDTLWCGVVGDLGWQNLVLGGHDPAGEALVDFQKELKALQRRGIILGIVSKNNEAVAMEAINRHPEMILKQDDFSGWRINWQDKAANIAELVSELNIGMNSVVFIDDNPVERDRVRSTLPEVLVPEWPTDKRLYAQTLVALDCFAKPSESAEDRKRTEMYVVERRRNELKSQAGSISDWLRTLEMVVEVQTLASADLARSVQLLNKTNQMNLSTRRMSESEYQAWLSQPGNIAWTVRVSDKFGDSGLTGLVSVTQNGNEAQITDFILSCRVMGRKIEEALLHHVVEWARTREVKVLQANYLRTDRNKPCLDILQDSRWTQQDNDRFTWDTKEDYPLSAPLTLKR